MSEMHENQLNIFVKQKLIEMMDVDCVDELSLKNIKKSLWTN